MAIGRILCAGLSMLSLAAAATEELQEEAPGRERPEIWEGEIGVRHLNLAYETVYISRVTRAYNAIVPNLARRTKAQLAEKYPHLEKDIARIVDETASGYAERQGELDLRIARSWAREFSESELKEISAFYATPTGTRLAKRNTVLIAAGLEAAREWGAEIGAEMVADVLRKLKIEGHEL